MDWSIIVVLGIGGQIDTSVRVTHYSILTDRTGAARSPHADRNESAKGRPMAIIDEAEYYDPAEEAMEAVGEDRQKPTTLSDEPLPYT
jgi:hypothetical protein